MKMFFAMGLCLYAFTGFSSAKPMEEDTKMICGDATLSCGNEVRICGLGVSGLIDRWRAVDAEQC